LTITHSRFDNLWDFLTAFDFLDVWISDGYQELCETAEDGSSWAEMFDFYSYVRYTIEICLIQ